MNYYQEALQKVTGLVLAEWALMLVDPLEKETKVLTLDQPFYVVEVKYSGLVCGQVTILCQESFVEILARNVLGMSESEQLSDADKSDSIKELGNVFSGNFVTSMYGEDTVFDLPSFNVYKANFEQLAMYINESAHWCAGDGQPFIVHYSSQG